MTPPNFMFQFLGAIYKKRAKTIAEIFSHFPSAKFSPKQNYDLLKVPLDLQRHEEMVRTTKVSDELHYKGGKSEKCILPLDLTAPSTAHDPPPQCRTFCELGTNWIFHMIMTNQLIFHSSNCYFWNFTARRFLFAKSAKISDHYSLVRLAK